jgi:hypothetical protein
MPPAHPSTVCPALISRWSPSRTMLSHSRGQTRRPVGIQLSRVSSALRLDRAAPGHEVAANVGFDLSRQRLASNGLAQVLLVLDPHSFPVANHLLAPDEQRGSYLFHCFMTGAWQGSV